MSSIHETAYPRLKPEPTTKEIEALYTPSKQELVLASQVKNPIARYCFIVHLKLFQRLGYFTPITEMPKEITDHIFRCAFNKQPTRKELMNYACSGTKNRHQHIIRKYLNVTLLTKKDDSWLEGIAMDAAETKEILSDIINVMLEELVRHHFELPGFTVIKKIARSARNRVNTRCFELITHQLSPELKKQINALFAKDNEHYSTWHTLKREPKKPSNKEVRRYLQHVHWLQSLGDKMPKVALPIAKHKQFTLEARALNAGEMADLKPNKRYALAVLLIKSQHSKALDDVAELFIKLARKMENQAQLALQKHLTEHQKQVDSLIQSFKEVLTVFQQRESEPEKIRSIEGIIGDDPNALIAQCDQHIAYAGNNYLPFMLPPYRQKRSLLFNCLRILDLYSTSNDKTTHTLLALLRALQTHRHEYLSLSTVNALIDEEFDSQWMPEKWRKLALLKPKTADGEPQLHRKYLELCIISHIKQELLSGDLHIPFSAQFDDYREQLVDDATLEHELEEYGEQVELPLTDARQFTKHLKQWLTDMSRQVDEAFPQNSYAEMNQGRLILRKQKPTIVTQGLQAIDDKLTQALPATSIIDILTDTEKWLNLNTFFSPLSGNDKRLDEPEKRFITTLFCYGCNLGPSQTARSIKGINRQQVAWLNLKHASEERLDKAITQVINGPSSGIPSKCIKDRCSPDMTGPLELVTN